MSPGIIPLPLCRWRKGPVNGQYTCHSVKYVNPPNLVTAEICEQCKYVDHDEPSILPPAEPCVHLGSFVIKQQPAEQDDKAGSPRQLFTCAVHGQCLPGVELDHASNVRCCGRCADYVPRHPLAPDSAQMARKAEAYLASIPEYPKGRYQGRGVVIVGGGDHFFPSLYITVRALRHVGCRLPIQVWYLGRNKEMSSAQRALLAPFDVECIDGDQVRREHRTRRFGGWELKVFATLHCHFEEVLFLDADCYPCRNPDFLFDLEEYRMRGAIFWPDCPSYDARLKWAAFGVPEPRRLGSVESGQFVINKRQSWRALNLAWFYNDHSHYYYQYGFGDKHTLEVAWQRCAQPFVMWETRARWLDIAYVHGGPSSACPLRSPPGREVRVSGDHGPEMLPLFIHRCRDKFRFERHAYSTPQTYPVPQFHALLPLERECWAWLSELARLTKHTLAYQKGTRLLRPSYKRQRSKDRFAIATLYTPEIADIGRRTTRVMWDYARRHGYEAVVAKATIDPSRSPIWSKILLVERYLVEHPACKWLMWIDADVVIMNAEQRLEDFVDEEVDFVVAEDPSPTAINVGVFLVRNCPATLDMLRRAYGRTHLLRFPWPEQMAIFEALQECSATVRTRIVSRRLFNCFAGEYHQGDFILHFAGYGGDAKLDGVKKAIAWAAKRRSRPCMSASQTPAPEMVASLLPRKPVSSANGHSPASPRSRPWRDLPPMYCITCWQTPERTARAARHFSRRRLKVQFFPGIHGRTFGIRGALPSEPNLPMGAGHIGCLLSHYILWQTLAYLPHEEILILEDDAWFDTSFRKRFRRAYAELPDDWQFVYVGSTVLESKPVERITERVGVVRYPCGTHAYLVKRSVLPFLLQTNHEARIPIDLQLMRNSLPGLKCYTFMPSLVKQRSACSPLDGTGENWPAMIGVPDDDCETAPT